MLLCIDDFLHFLSPLGGFPGLFLRFLPGRVGDGLGGFFGLYLFLVGNLI
jgi:hypothetical protein